VPWRSASELSRLRLKRPERLVRPDAKDAIFFFPDVAGHFPSGRTVSWHFPSGRSCVRVLSFWTQPCQGIFLLDTSGRCVSWQYGHAGCQGAERRSKYSGPIRKHAVGSRHSDSVQFYCLYLRYVHLYMLLHTSRFQQKHPASHPSPRSSHAVMLF